MMKFRKISAFAAALMLTAGLLSAAAIPTTAADVRRFDLGDNSQNGWTSVSASDGYNESRGYGFSGRCRSST